MAADTLSAGHGLRPSFDEASVLFVYEATAEGRIVTRLFGIDTDGEAVRIAAEIYPVHAPETSDAQWRFYDFPTRKHAKYFADETLLALEYLGCTVSESDTLVPDSPARANRDSAASTKVDSAARAKGASDRFAA